MADQTVVGRVGSVCRAIRGGERPGEVRVVVDGLPHYYIGYSKGALALGAEILVINNRGGRQVDVEPWADASSGALDRESERY